MFRISAYLHLPGACLLFWILRANLIESQRQPQPGEYPSLSYIPRTSFDCRKRPIGYYADQDPATKCQVYHMCDMNGKKFSYLCPNGTLFHQQHLICAHWYQVNCTRSEALYDKINAHMFPFPSGPRPVQWKKSTNKTISDSTVTQSSFGTPLRNLQQDSRQTATTTEGATFGDVTHSVTESSTLSWESPATTSATTANPWQVESDISPWSIANQVAASNSIGPAIGNQWQNADLDTPNANAVNPIENFGEDDLANSVAQRRSAPTTTRPARWFPTSTLSPALRTPSPTSWPVRIPDPNSFGATLPRVKPIITTTTTTPKSAIFATGAATNALVPIARSVRHEDVALQSTISDERQPKTARLTMKFPKSKYRAFSEGRGLSTSEKCPHCNPYFVRNDLLCFPCVVIR